VILEINTVEKIRDGFLKKNMPRQVVSVTGLDTLVVLKILLKPLFLGTY